MILYAEKDKPEKEEVVNEEKKSGFFARGQKEAGEEDEKKVEEKLTKKDEKKTQAKASSGATAQTASSAVTATNIYGGKVVVNDAPSGRKYIFPSGVSVELHPDDVEHIRGKMRESGGCCGRPLQSTPYFQVDG